MNPKAERLVGINDKGWKHKKYFEIFKLEDEDEIHYQRSLIESVSKFSTKIQKTKAFYLLNQKFNRKLGVTQQLNPFPLEGKKNGVYINIFDVTSDILFENTYFKAEKNSIEEISTLTMELTLNKTDSLLNPSKIYPEIKFFFIGYIIDPKYSLDHPIGINLIQFQNRNWKNIMKLLKEHSSVISVEQWATHPSTLLSIKNNNNYLYPIFQQVGINMNFPTLIQNGKEKLKITSTKGNIKNLFNRLKAQGIEFRILSIGKKSDEKQKILTDKQRNILKLAITHNYFDNPRGITLTELAEVANVGASSLSRRLRRVFENIAKSNTF